jgi:hypothetical protein
METKMGEACSTHEGCESFLLGNSKGRDHLEKLDVDGKKLLVYVTNND